MKFLCIARPYYALESEYAIMDDGNVEIVGFVCIARVKMPYGHKSGGIPFAEAGCHILVVGSVVALLCNHQKKRYVYDRGSTTCFVFSLDSYLILITLISYMISSFYWLLLSQGQGGASKCSW